MPASNSTNALACRARRWTAAPSRASSVRSRCDSLSRHPGRIMGFGRIRLGQLGKEFLEFRPSRGIPRSRDNSELRWVYDTEIVSNLITIGTPVLRHVVAQKAQHSNAEVLEGGIALVVGDVPMHQTP